MATIAEVKAELMQVLDERFKVHEEEKKTWRKEVEGWKMQIEKDMEVRLDEIRRCIKEGSKDHGWNKKRKERLEPEEFKGKDFTAWDHALKLYIEECFKEGEEVMNWAGKEKNEIDDAMMSPDNDGKVNEELWSVINSKIKDSSGKNLIKKIAKTVTRECRGMEAYRAIKAYYKPETEKTVYHLKKKLINMGPSKNLSEMSERITEQEDIMAEIQSKENKEMPEDIKALYLRAIVTPSIDEEIEKRQDMAENYRKIRDYCVSLANSEKEKKNNKKKEDKDPDKMDLDTMTAKITESVLGALGGAKAKGKGKADGGKGGKGKGESNWQWQWQPEGSKGKAKGGGKGGKGKGKADKGKGKGGQGKAPVFYGACNYCWEEGHSKWYCPKLGLKPYAGAVEEEEEKEEEHEEEEEEEGEELGAMTETDRNAWEGDMCAMMGEHMGYTKVEAMVDSGACTSIMPMNVCAQVPIKDGPKKGVKYEAVSGHSIENKGESMVGFETDESERRSLKFQRGDKATKTLAAVGNITDKDHLVVMGKNGGAIIQDPEGRLMKELLEAAKKAKSRTTPFRRKGGVYVLDMWVPQESSYTGSQKGADKAQRPKKSTNTGCKATGCSRKEHQNNPDNMDLDGVWMQQNAKGRARPRGPF